VVVIVVFHFGLVNEVSLVVVSVVGRQRWPVTVGFGNEGAVISDPSSPFAFVACFLTVFLALIPELN
jgi:hypothetical protein